MTSASNITQLMITFVNTRKIWKSTSPANYSLTAMHDFPQTSSAEILPCS